MMSETSGQDQRYAHFHRSPFYQAADLMARLSYFADSVTALVHANLLEASAGSTRTDVLDGYVTKRDAYVAALGDSTLGPQAREAMERAIDEFRRPSSDNISPSTDQQVVRQYQAHTVRAIAPLMVELCQIAERARMVINGIELWADRTTNEDALFHEFIAKMEAHLAAQPGAAERKVEAANRRAIRQAAYDAHVDGCKTLDFGNDVAVAEWLCGLEERSYIDLAKRTTEIIDTFRRHGFTEHAPSGGPSERIRLLETRDGHFGDIVRQALASLLGEVGAIPPMIHRAVQLWKEQHIPSV